jgi:hypothetical protein
MNLICRGFLVQLKAEKTQFCSARFQRVGAIDGIQLNFLCDDGRLRATVVRPLFTVRYSFGVSALCEEGELMNCCGLVTSPSTAHFSTPPINPIYSDLSISLALEPTS